MSRSGWKAAERAIAKDCGGRRIPVTGERHGADVSHPLFDYQLKVRRALPVWLFAWLHGIVGTAKRSDRVGVLVLNRPRQPRRHAVVILRWEDWVALHGTPSVECLDEPEAALTFPEVQS
jgi:hypothetical protein